IQDRLFDRNGFLVYDNFDHNGFLGDKFLVNGKIQPFLKVQRRKYRFRILNGSSARVYQLFLSNNQPFVAIATDSTLLERPVTVQNFRLAPAERVEVVIDFTFAPDEVFLVNRLQQTDGRKPDKLVDPGTPLLKFVVAKNAVRDPSRVPRILLPVTEGPAQLLPQVRVQRRFEFNRSNGAWQINGEFFDENRVDARPRAGEPEIWILESPGGWVHPVHIHLSDFFILSRDGKRPPVLEQGRKDTVLIGGDVARETRILIEFEDSREVPRAGDRLRYVFHCHNIEHEDMRMMSQFEVQT
ncbi:MAG TPA: multicopper oxidase domain-containing protein, partial [Thermoanaerobaculia bacterium]|nr:multicopper oxidase domain-containing protein [Thermoanaerobaculia bacterium]